VAESASDPEVVRPILARLQIATVWQERTDGGDQLAVTRRKRDVRPERPVAEKSTKQVWIKRSMTVAFEVGRGGTLDVPTGRTVLLVQVLS
jgi:hypothetical protein